MAGPIFRYNAATAGSGGFPAYYDGSWLINNRGANDGWWKEVKIRNDNQQMLGVKDWLPYNNAGTATTQQNSLVIGTQFGDDGALYMARYPVTCCRNNTSATSSVQIVKVTFDVYEETNAPSVTAAFDPATPGNGRTYTGPVTLNFTSTDPANADPAQPQAGVDYIEHRVILNGVPGPWVRSTNPGLVNPYTQLGHGVRAGCLLDRVPLGRPRRQRRGRQDGDVLDQPPDDESRARSARSCPARSGSPSTRWCSVRSSRVWRRRTPPRPPRR